VTDACTGNEDMRFTIVDNELPPNNKTTWTPEFTEVHDIEGNVYRFVGNDNSIIFVVAILNVSSINQTVSTKIRVANFLVCIKHYITKVYY